jgi:hypothetical protein
LRIAAFRLAHHVLTEKKKRGISDTATAGEGAKVFGGARPKGDCDDQQ